EIHSRFRARLRGTGRGKPIRRDRDTTGENVLTGRPIRAPVQRRPLGRTGLDVSEIGFGAWAIGGNAHGNSYGPTKDTESIEAVRRAVDLGVNFFDTADVYGWGHSEEVLGQALEGRREEVFLATKVGGDFYRGGVRMNFDPGYLAFALDRSLQRLRTDHVDLYQLHNPPAELMTDPTTYEVLDALKGEHKIDHYGVSVHAPVDDRGPECRRRTTLFPREAKPDDGPGRVALRPGLSRDVARDPRREDGCAGR